MVTMATCPRRGGRLASQPPSSSAGLVSQALLLLKVRGVDRYAPLLSCSDIRVSPSLPFFSVPTHCCPRWP